VRLLAIDYGLKATGLAITDELRLTTRPLATIRRSRQRPVDLPREILRYVEEYEVGLLLVGLPLNMDGTRGEAARRVERFIDELQPLLRIPIQLVDERLTSRAADERLRNGGASDRQRRERSDEYAALIILEDYLAAVERTPSPSPPPTSDD
jgi:putative Holliday junction resolvase